MPDKADRHEIRIRVTGTNNAHQDIEDLKAWLEREPWLAHQRHDWTLRPRPTDGDGAADERDLGDMAIGIDDLVLVLIGTVAAEVTKSLSIALREWLRRRREERAAGEQPAVAVGGDGGLAPVGDPGPRGTAPERPDPASRSTEGGSAGED
ncbi:hypothetical protein [Streptomyces sp. NPDC017993]|uniref:hypothetical protein n=1 Tax=Streptomyces sp. NPDC017993 TaxID=3365027 RepID=UPI00379F1D61